jgi:DNA-binding beta-propeller fold protein YncE
MRIRQFSSDRWIAIVAIAATAGIATATLTLQPALKVNAVPGGASGHPMDFTPLLEQGHPNAANLAMLMQQSAQAADAFAAMVEEAPVPDDFEIPAGLLAPLASGEYVNFESPDVSPIQVSSDGQRVFAVNTPNNSLVVLDATNRLTKLSEIFVGLEPVSLQIQPGTNDSIVWVSNIISDTVAVVDVLAEKVIDVIDVGDEPVNIVFDPAGDFAFVVIQGSPFVPDNAAPTGSPFVALGHLVTIDTATKQVVSNTFLDCNTPRAIVYDQANDHIVIAAHHSGNNTSLAGTPVELRFADPVPTNPAPIVSIPPQARDCLLPDPCTSNGCQCMTMPNLWVAQQFSATAAVFDPNPGSESQLSPWPDDLGSSGAPLVPRIVSDSQGDWFDITQNILTDANGDPNPAMVALMNQEFGILNADEVIHHMASDAKDTLDHDLIVIDASNPGASIGVGLPIVNVVGNVGTTLTGMDQNPATGGLFVTNLQALNTVRLGENLNGHFLNHVIEIVDDYTLASPTITHSDLHSGIDNFHNVSTPNPNAKAKSLAHPNAIAFHDSGTWAAVASLGMDRIGILNGSTGRVLGRLDVPSGPRGLSIDSANNLIYVLSRHAMTVTAVDVSTFDAPQVVDSRELFNPEPRHIRDGRKFHYSTAFSHNGAHSCDSCHPNTDFDRLAWDLGAFGTANQPGPPNMPEAFNHPLKGPMVTQSLRGLDRHEPLHWRGDKPAFTDFNEAFANLLGGDEIPAEDMDAFNAFIKSVIYRPNPYFKRTNAYKEPRALDGLITYINFCNACHQVIPALGNEFGHDGSAFTTNGDSGINATGFFAQLQIITQMRGLHKKFIGDVYDGFGMVHDGREEREDNEHPLQTFLNEFFPEAITDITPQQQLDMIAAMNAFPSNVMNVVGWQLLVDSPAAPAVTLSNIDVMVAQYQKIPSHCDIIAKGTVEGAHRGYWLTGVNGGQRDFMSNTGELITQSALVASLQPGDSLVFTAVPPGSGKRIGIDQDTDGLLDGNDPMAQHDNTGDFDLDGDVDLADHAMLQQCFNVPGALGVPSDCELGDADEDDDVDIFDYDEIQYLHTGPKS